MLAYRTSLTSLLLIKLIISVSSIYKTGLIIPFHQELNFNNAKTTEQIFYEIEHNTLSVEFQLGHTQQPYKFNLASKLCYAYLVNSSATENKNITTFDCFKDNGCRTSYFSIQIFDEDLQFGHDANVNSSFGIDNGKVEVYRKEEMYLILATNLTSNQSLLKNSGKLGLGANCKSNFTPSFLSELKAFKKVLQESFFLEFDESNGVISNNGKLVIGLSPSEYNNEKYKEENFSWTNIYSSKEIKGKDFYEWSFGINQIYYGDKKPINRNYVIKNGYIRIEEGMLEGPVNIKEIIYADFFEEYVKVGKCRENVFNELLYYDCDIGVDIGKMKSIFFVNELTDNIFEMKPEDLFYEHKNILYYLVRFKQNLTHYDHWILGLPFYKKYFMYYYSDSNDTKKIYIRKTNVELPGSDDDSGSYGFSGSFDLKAGYIALIVVAGIGFVFLLFISIHFFFIKKKNNHQVRTENNDYACLNE